MLADFHFNYKRKADEEEKCTHCDTWLSWFGSVLRPAATSSHPTSSAHEQGTDVLQTCETHHLSISTATSVQYTDI
jgi:hypothetical protein